LDTTVSALWWVAFASTSLRRRRANGSIRRTREVVRRWFEPAGELPRAGATPFTGEWTDGFGSRLLSLAVVNPSFSQAEFREHHPDSNGFGDRGLKSEGYGILRIDPEAREYTFEAWRWDSDPTAVGAEQYPGWPYVLSFDDV
jgi:alkaline phosphatase D